MRIVTICVESPEQENLDDILWAPLSPASPVSVYSDDIATLHKLQRISFMPASTLCLEPQRGQLIAVKVYSPLGFHAGVTGIGLIYDTNLETTWGLSADVASSTFFLGETEQLIKATVYKTGSLVCHLEVGCPSLCIAHLMPFCSLLRTFIGRASPSQNCQRI